MKQKSIPSSPHPYGSHFASHFSVNAFTAMHMYRFCGEPLRNSSYSCTPAFFSGALCGAPCIPFEESGSILPIFRDEIIQFLKKLFLNKVHFYERHISTFRA